MLTDLYVLSCIWVHEIQFAAWYIGAELKTDLTYLELVNYLVGWILQDGQSLDLYFTRVLEL